METEIKIDNKFYIYAIAGILGIIFVFFLTSYVIPKAMISLTRAAPATVVSVGNSYVLGDKLLAKANGQDKAIINVFVMDKEGRGVSGKTVSLQGLSKISPASVITDAQGKAVFSLVSTVETQDTVSALVEGVPLSKTVIVTFRN